MESLGLIQYAQDPTRVQSESSTCIDHMFIY